MLGKRDVKEARLFWGCCRDEATTWGSRPRGFGLKVDRGKHLIRLCEK